MFVSNGFKNKGQVALAVFEFLEDLLSVPTADIKEAVTIAALVLHLLRKFSPFLCENLDTQVWQPGLKPLNLATRRQPHDPLILKAA